MLEEAGGAPNKEALAKEEPHAAPAGGVAAAAVGGAGEVQSGAKQAEPAAALKPNEDEEEDLEISDEEGAAAAGEADSDVDEDWGGDWE